MFKSTNLIKLFVLMLCILWISSSLAADARFSLDEASNLSAHSLLSGSIIDATKLPSTFTVNKGSEDRVVVGMCVLSDKGLIGRVVSVEERNSLVHTLLSPENSESCSAMVESVRETGIVSVTAQDSQFALSLLHLPQESTLQVGEAVYTAGVDTLYPRGLLIGHVLQDRASEDSDGLLLQPVADFAELQNVEILLIPSK